MDNVYISVFTYLLVCSSVLKDQGNNKIELKIEFKSPEEPFKVLLKQSLCRNGIIKRKHIPEHINANLV